MVIDPVTAEVIRSAMETICFEMATYVSRTATTPILNQSNERNATILDGQGRLAALSVGIPQFMLSATLPVRFCLEYLEGELYPGDVLVANDPYHGGGHLPDFNVFSPVFAPDGSGDDSLDGTRCWSRRSSATTATPVARSPVATTCSPRTSGRRGRATRC